MTTPNPITTAREALDKAYEVCRNLGGTDDADFHAISAALDYAEKLKIEDEILHAANAEFSQAAIESHAEVLRLTSQLDGIMKCISYRKAIYQTKKDAADPLVDDTMTHWESLDDRITAFEYLEAEIASQWIKDRQAKTDGEAS